MNIIIYTKTGCPWCSEVLDLLKNNNIPFDEREVLANKIFFNEMVAKSAQTKAPTLDIDGKIFADSDRNQVYQFLKKENILA